ncbi:MAG: hypothetical protein OET79_06335, partial [Nitrospirota bacterium]|nr:hypothetical protein [Nitrospirota bacterium]
PEDFRPLTDGGPTARVPPRRKRPAQGRRVARDRKICLDGLWLSPISRLICPTVSPHHVAAGPYRSRADHGEKHDILSGNSGRV